MRKEAVSLEKANPQAIPKTGEAPKRNPAANASDWYRAHLRHLVQEEAPQVEEKAGKEIERLFASAEKGNTP